MKFQITCSQPGPRIGEEVPHCQLKETHNLQGQLTRHEWWCDDGSIKIEWDSDWKLGPGRWRGPLWKESDG